MTEFMRRARYVIDEVTSRRKRPLLLGVRVLDTVQACVDAGIDIETWLREGLVDRVLAGGGYASFADSAAELVSIGHRFDVPVYPCINCPGTFALGAGRGFQTLKGAAANFWLSGADGIYLWNYHYLETPHRAYGQPCPEDYVHLADISDPLRLSELDKIFSVNPRPLEQYIRGSAPCPLPLNLDSRSHKIPVLVGGDMIKSPRTTLELDIEPPDSDIRLAIRFNDFWLDGCGQSCSEYPLPASVVHQGLNNLSISLNGHSVVTETPAKLTGVRLHISYDKR